MTKHTEKKLYMAAITFLLCVLAMIGSTFAWITDSARSGANVITVGNIDIEFEYWDGEEWKDVSNSTEIIDSNILWEPGHSEVVYLKLKNVGSLNAKYDISVSVLEETEGVDVNGDPIKLSDYIYYKVTDGVNGETATVEASENNTEQGTLISEGYLKSGIVEGGDELYLAMEIYMPDWVQVNHNGVDIPKISITFGATAMQVNAGGSNDNTNPDDDTTVPDDDTTDPDDNSGTTPTLPTISEINYSGETVFVAGDNPTIKAIVTYSDGRTEEIEVTDDMYLLDDGFLKPDFSIPATYTSKIALGDATTDVITFRVVDPTEGILIPNSDFVYGAYYDLNKGDGVSMMTSGDYVKGKTSHTLLTNQSIIIKINDTDLSKYNVTLSYFDADGNYLSRDGITKITNGEIVIPASAVKGSYFRVSVYIYSPFTRIPESAEINVYKTPASAEKINENTLINNSEFVYGSYYDLDKGDGVSMMTSGAYGLGKTSHKLLERQDVTVKVIDNDLSKYNVTVSYFDADGNYKGRSGILKMTDGVIHISASSIPTTHFRVSVYIYSPFTLIPETASINVYKKQSDIIPWDGDMISIVGDSISTGGYPGLLGNMTGAAIDNNAVSGTTVAGTGGLVAQLSNIDANADLIIVFGGTNDYWRGSIAIGSLSDEGTSTYLGSMKYILNYLKANHPDAEYLFLFPYDQAFGGNTCDTNFGNGTLEDFREAFISFCTEYNLEYIDLGETEFDYTQHTGDGVHANSAGHQIIAQAIYDKISKN